MSFEPIAVWFIIANWYSSTTGVVSALGSRFRFKPPKLHYTGDLPGRLTLQTQSEMCSAGVPPFLINRPHTWHWHLRTESRRLIPRSPHLMWRHINNSKRTNALDVKPTGVRACLPYTILQCQFDLCSIKTCVIYISEAAGSQRTNWQLAYNLIFQRISLGSCEDSRSALRRDANLTVPLHITTCIYSICTLSFDLKFRVSYN